MPSPSPRRTDRLRDQWSPTSPQVDRQTPSRLDSALWSWALKAATCPTATYIGSLTQIDRDERSPAGTTSLWRLRGQMRPARPFRSVRASMPARQKRRRRVSSQRNRIFWRDDRNEPHRVAHQPESTVPSLTNTHKSNDRGKIRSEVSGKPATNPRWDRLMATHTAK
jgi:hypothetical protein